MHMFGNRTELCVFLYYSLFIARAKVHAHKTIRMQMPAAGTRQHWKSLNGKNLNHCLMWTQLEEDRGQMQKGSYTEKIFYSPKVVSEVTSEHLISGL